MSFLLCAVVWSVVILFIILTVQAVAGDLHNGLKWGLSARDTSKEDTVFIGRTKRTVANHIEGMMLFVPLALVAVISGTETDLMVKGAWIYLIARAVYPLTYWTGLPVVRTLIWFASIIGTAMVGFGLI